MKAIFLHSGFGFLLVVFMVIPTISYTQWTTRLLGSLGRSSALALIIILLVGNSVQAQWMKIDSLGGNPDPSAALEISDTSRGLLPPRLTTAQMNAIGSPAAGLFIFNTTDSVYKYFDGNTWQSVGSGTGGTTVTTDWTSYSPTFIGFGTVTIDTFYWRRDGSDLLIRGKFKKGGSGSAVEASVSLPSGLTISSDLASVENAGTAAWTGGATSTSYTVLIEPGDQSFGFGYSTNSSGALVKTNGNVIFSNSSTQVLNARIPIQGWTGGSGSTGTSISSVDESGVLIMKDEKSSGTASGTFTSGAWRTRDLNTKYGDTSFASLASNQFTLQPGVYMIEATAVAHKMTSHKIRLRDITNSNDVVLGLNAYNHSTDNTASSSTLEGVFTVATSTTFEIQHRGSSTQSSDGFGPSNSFGVNEVYAQVKITKLDKVFGSSTNGSSSSSADTLDENVFSARISSTGTVISENIDWVSSVSKTGTGEYTITFNTSHFTAAPSMVAVAENSSQYDLTVESVTTTSAKINIWTSLGISSDISFNIIAQRQGSDYKYNTSGASSSTLSSSNGDSTRIIDKDADTYIATENAGGVDNDNLRFITSGNERMRIKATGEVGIGTSSPSEKLHLYGGNARIESNTTVDAYMGFFANNNAGGYIFHDHSTNNFVLRHNDVIGDAHLVLDSLGSIGIGTTTPTELLHLYKASDTPYLLIESDGSFDSKVITANGTSSSWAMGIDASASDNFSIAYDTDRDPSLSGNSKFVMTTGGKVGIGMTPTDNLSVMGNVQLHVTDPGTGNTAWSYLHMNTIGNNGGTVRQGQWKMEARPLNNFGDPVLTFIKSYDGGAETEYMRLDNTGKLGIGTNSPDSMLTVNGGIKSTYLTMTNGAGANKVLTSDANGVASWQAPSSSPWNISGSNLYYTTGNVGIGTSSPNYFLQLHEPSSAQSQLQFTNTTTGTGTSDGTVLGLSANEDFLLLHRENSSVIFYTNNVDRMTITGAGNVGINTTTPLEKLQIQGNQSNFLFTGGSPHSVMSHGSLIMDIDENNNGTTSQFIVRKDSTTELLVVEESGNIGMGGITAPVASLDIDGDIGLDTSPSSNTSVNGITSVSSVDASTSGISRALYIKSNGNYDFADADAASTMPCVALAVETGTGSKKIVHYGFATNSSWSWTTGGLIYVSTTSGQLTQTPPTGTGDQVQIVGYATSATTIFFNPSYVTVEVGP
ncbi:MAG: hypothetical protein CL840_18680 [Crocinitomicaceae bacterium]|nr:hypothetical protein [Crocinitomicaceae bacterium]|tara:strand:- start:1857 stop:5489 length:3633 start_codon:yes stop_codon:yes gene_type:complete